MQNNVYSCLHQTLITQPLSVHLERLEHTYARLSYALVKSLSGLECCKHEQQQMEG